MVRRLSIFCALLLGAHSAVGQDRESLAYQRALVAYGQGLDATIGRLDSPVVQSQFKSYGPRPVVVLMHGCDGIVRSGTDTPHPAYRQALVDLVREGFFVLAPDSFASSRVGNCEGQVGTQEVQRMRRKELAYALDRVALEPWASRERLYVLGQSEGARTVMTYGRYPSHVRAVVGTGWTCWDGEDISLPPPTPYLLIWAKGDPKHRVSRGCTVRENGEFYSPNYGKHWVWGDPGSYRRIMAMLSR